MRGPRRRESEVRPVRRAQVHLGTNPPPARAAQSFRYHLLHDRSAASGPRSGTGGSYPEGPPRRGDPKAPGGRTGHGGDASPRGTVHAADRAVRIVEYWMGKVAGEEGRFDIDIIQTGISQSQREQIISIRDIINELAGPEGVADYEDIVRLAQERGIPPAKVDSWLK